MLGTIRQDITKLDYCGQLEFFTKYCERRKLDLLKPSTYDPGGKAKKAKAKAAAKTKPKAKGKQVSVNKLKQLDAEGLALLKKMGIEL